VSGSPLSYLNAAGSRANHILPLTLFTLAVSVIVCLVIGTLLWLAVRHASAPQGTEVSAVPVESGDSGLRWIGVGLAISAVPLLATLVWTMFALAAIAGPPANPALILDITARQWWWNVQYNGALPSDQFNTANEIHIPVGRPVLVRLHAGDVIHSFWVPKLTGKTDVIPGQTNQSWMQADTPGRYLGQCSEYCGWQHAHMQFEVVADTESDYRAWLQAQRNAAAAPDSDAAARGLEVVQGRCALCHAVRGTSAGAVSGPDLTHLMSRRTLAAGTLPNTPGSLAGWIQDPQDAKPGSLMPNQYLSAQQLSDVVAYLETLK
jgi:cytochrome c oxidase subunit 2